MLILIFCIGLFSAITKDVVQAECVHVDTSSIRDEIKIHKRVTTWEKANLQCQNEGLILASPINSEFLYVMRSKISVNDATYFIGTKASQPGSYVSIEGVPLDDMATAMAEMVHQLDPRDGDCLSMNRESIRVVSCNARLPYICTKEHDLAKSKLKCSKGYKFDAVTSRCYKVHGHILQWGQAQGKCVEEGGYLAVIDDAVEAQAITRMNITYEFPYTFVGIHFNDGQWRSVNGQPVDELYDVWNGGYKPTDPVSFTCGVIMVSGELANYSCETEREFICEKDPIRV